MRVLLPFLLACSTTSNDAGADDDASNLDAISSSIDSPIVCEPQELTDFAPPDFVPPVPKQSACTSPQIQAFYTQCAADPTSASCTSWQAMNATCAACVGTADTQTAWGALVLRMGAYVANRSGCIATLGYLDCAKRLDALWACTDASCSDVCMVSGLAGCRTAAEASVCKMYRSDADAVCPMDGSSLSLCLQDPLQKFYLAFAPILCSSGG